MANATPDYEGTLNRVSREVAEVALKFLSWTIMYAAIMYAAERTKSSILQLASYLVLLLLAMYLQGHVYRIQEFCVGHFDFIRYSTRRNVLIAITSLIITAVV